MTPGLDVLVLALACLFWWVLMYASRRWWTRESCWLMAILATGEAFAALALWVKGIAV